IFAQAVTVLDAHPEMGFTFGKALEIKEGHGAVRGFGGFEAESRDRSGYRILAGPEFIERSGPRCIVPALTAVVRTSLQKSLGGYCPELSNAGDMEMWLRLAAHSSVGM